MIQAPQTADTSSNETANNTGSEHYSTPQYQLMENLLKTTGGVALPRAGDVVEGFVLDKKGGKLFIDLGIKGVGIIYGREYYAAQEQIKNLQPGDPISAKVVEVDNEEGYLELSLKEAGEERRWINLKRMMDEGEVLELPVKEANRGGLILEAENVKGFLPTSQLSPQNYPRVEGGDKEMIFQELKKLVGQSLKIKILDVSPSENKLIFTEKKQSSEEIHDLLLKFKIGDEVEGEITGVVDFGAFVRLEGTEFEGLIHISEIDWSLIEDPRLVLKTGDKVRAKIIDIQGEKISLSLKALKPDPWIAIAEKYHKEDVVRGKVTKFNTFGAFVQINDELHGLVHISEFGTEAKMKEELEVEKEYDFKIAMINPKEHRMSLAMPREKDNSPQPLPSESA